MSKEIKKLNKTFNLLHDELLSKGEYDLARKLSDVYWGTQIANFKDGINKAKEIYNK